MSRCTLCPGSCGKSIRGAVPYAETPAVFRFDLHLKCKHYGFTTKRYVVGLRISCDTQLRLTGCGSPIDLF